MIKVGVGPMTLGHHRRVSPHGYQHCSAHLVRVELPVPPSHEADLLIHWQTDRQGALLKMQEDDAVEEAKSSVQVNPDHAAGWELSEHSWLVMVLLNPAPAVFHLLITGMSPVCTPPVARTSTVCHLPLTHSLTHLLIGGLLLLLCHTLRVLAGHTGAAADSSVSVFTHPLLTGST